MDFHKCVRTVGTAFQFMNIALSDIRGVQTIKRPPTPVKNQYLQGKKEFFIGSTLLTFISFHLSQTVDYVLNRDE